MSRKGLTTKQSIMEKQTKYMSLDVEKYKKLGWRGTITTNGKISRFAGWTFDDVTKKMDAFLKATKVPVKCECR